jgi:DNA-binding NarL/FixJ family response regulator
LLNGALDLDLAAAVKHAASSETVLDPKVSRPGAEKGELNHGLTARELQVLQLICDGLTNRAIAEKLQLSVNTVAVHRANIMQTLGLHKTAEVVAYALRNGLVNVL